MNLLNKAYSEKRNFLRMKVDTEMTLSMDTESIVGVCRDLSGDGMLIEVEKEVVLGSMLNISVPSARPEFPALEATVEVVRVTPASSGNYMIGVIIKEIAL